MFRPVSLFPEVFAAEPAYKLLPDFEHGGVCRKYIDKRILVSEAFEKYIGDGCKCYVGRFKVSPMEAVELIHAAGGIAVLAHPLLYHMNQTTLQHLIDELKEVHLDGIEAIYSTYTTGEEQYVKRLAKENGLLISGGSDFHGTNKPTIQIGTGRGHLYIPYSVLETIKEHLRA